jgi:hypothetical protein
MKKLLAILLLSPCAALAAPFVVSDPLDSSATHCGVFMDATPKQTIPVTVEGAGKICKFDLQSIGNGSHSVRMTAIANDPMWGQVESAQSAPLAFVRPAAPATPAGVRLAP